MSLSQFFCEKKMKVIFRTFSEIFWERHIIVNPQFALTSNTNKSMSDSSGNNNAQSTMNLLFN